MFSIQELYDISNALRVAADVYREDAASLKATPKLSDHFMRQAKEADRLSAKAEEMAL